MVYSTQIGIAYSFTIERKKKPVQNNRSNWTLPKFFWCTHPFMANKTSRILILSATPKACIFGGITMHSHVFFQVLFECKTFGANFTDMRSL